MHRAGARSVLVLQAILLLFASALSAQSMDDEAATVSGVQPERYRKVEMPPGFQVVPTELEGPVFANEAGMTLYKWPLHKLRNGYSGEAPGEPACDDQINTVTAGLMSPYPPGIPLPDLDSRPACTDLWLPVVATADAEPVGLWTVVERSDGQKQWAYDEQPLYTSVRDQQPGDTFGGTSRKKDGDSPAIRVPVGPPPLVPPGFAVKSTSVGRMLTTKKNYAVYSFEQDSAEETRCTGDCTKRFKPVIAPTLVRAQGEWSVLERSPGERQWVFRGKPLYTHVRDTHPWSQEGSDEPGWSNVFTQRTPEPPSDFIRQATIAGDVLADRRGHTVYLYQCGEDSQIQLACDHPDDTQVYRLAICGGGDPERCNEYWPYVTPSEGATSDSRAWSILNIDPATGRKVSEDAPSAQRVWAYRDRPVYTFALDRKPGDVKGAGTGEWRGKRNGLLAFWLRDDFMKGIE